MDLKEGTVEEASGHWYYEHKWELVKIALKNLKYKPAVVKDVGSGSGVFSEKFTQHWPKTEVYAVDTGYTNDMLGPRNKVNYVKNLEDAPSGDLYTLMDVLEHVENDVELLKTCVDEANPGASFLITVPAFQTLWSPHDVFLGHYRRYRLEQMENVAKAAGLKIDYSKYTYAPLFIPAFVIRKINNLMKQKPASNMKQTNKLVSWLLANVLKTEKLLKNNRTFGVSLLVLASKPE